MKKLIEEEVEKASIDYLRSLNVTSSGKPSDCCYRAGGLCKQVWNEDLTAHGMATFYYVCSECKKPCIAKAPPYIMKKLTKDEARAAFDKADEAYSNAYEAYSKAYEARYEASEAVDKTGAAVDKASAARYEAGKAFDEADEACDKAYEARTKALAVYDRA